MVFLITYKWQKIAEILGFIFSQLNLLLNFPVKRTVHRQDFGAKFMAHSTIWGHLIKRKYKKLNKISEWFKSFLRS